jgi:transposase
MNLTVTNVLKRVLPLKRFRYRSARWVENLSGDGQSVIEVELAARQGAKACCGRCARPAPGYDCPQKVRCWQFISLWAIQVYFLYAPRRVECKCCGVRVERLPWASGKLQICDALRSFLAQWARLLSWQEVAVRFQVRWNDVYGAVKWVVRYGLRHRDLSGIRALGVDEVCVAKKKLWTVVYQIDAGARRLLWIGRDRKAATLEMIFNRLGQERCAAVQFICSDMWRGYLGVIARRLPQALHILDRFHIRKNLAEAIDQIRRAETHALARAGLAPLLKKLRWALLKHRRNWTAKERSRMRHLLGCGLRSLRAFLLVESFEHFWTYNSPTWADKFLKGWCQRVARSRLAPLHKVAKSLAKYRALLLNYFIARKEYSSGVVEGLNNKLKLTLKKSYGFRTDLARKVALYHALAHLPEPHLTHSFF